MGNPSVVAHAQLIHASATVALHNQCALLECRQGDRYMHQYIWELLRELNPAQLHEPADNSAIE